MPLNTESAVKSRYAAGARATEPALCCPVEYDGRYLDVIPAEVVERDYGCGDPSRHLHPGETVLDLGSGTGKICFIAAQVVGPEGRVIGVDMTDEMLEVARRNAPVVAERIGYANVEFRRGRIQDLALDLDLLEQRLSAKPVNCSNRFLEIEEAIDEMRRTEPMVPDESVDVVVSNCVLNLVGTGKREQLFAEIHRVLKPGGRAVISDIVSDEDVPEALRHDPELWSGCISGAFREDRFLDAFKAAGFVGIELLALDPNPWRTVEGIEFRSLTVRAFKPESGPCLERRQAVIYKGPFQAVIDDEGHEMIRGRRYAVCDRTFSLYRRPPYAGHFQFLEPRTAVPIGEAAPFDCTQTGIREPREMKQGGEAAGPATCCGADGGCC